MKKKILFRLHALEGGGAEKVLLTIFNHINFNKYDIDLFLTTKGGVYDKLIPEKVNIKYIFLGDNQLPKNTVIRSIYKRYRKHTLSLLKRFPDPLYWFNFQPKYDIEIAFLQDLIPIIANSPLKNSKKIAWVHNDLYAHKALTRKKKEKICKSLNKYDKIVTVSNDVATTLMKLYGDFDLGSEEHIAEKLHTIFNPLDFEEIHRKSLEFPVDKNKDTLVAVGRLNVAKRFDRLINVHKKLLDNGFEHNLWIIGEGTLREELEKQIEQNKLKNSVSLLGFKSNPYPYVKAADVFILSSDYEGFALVVAEAMVLGKPIVSTKVTGATELIKLAKTGTLVEKNELALYEGIKDLLAQKKLTSIVKPNDKTIEFFNAKKVIIEIESLFDSV